MIRSVKMPKLYRSMEIDLKKVVRGEGEEEKATYEVAISSEHPVTRWFGTEVLAHSPASVDMSRLRSGAAVLVDHRGDQVGVVESARVDDDKVLRGVIRFSANQRGQEVERDVVDRIRRHVSVGYIPVKARIQEQEEGKPDTWRVTRWTPLEVSIVSVPADPSVGVGREVADDESYSVEVEEPDKEETRMDPKIETGTVAPVAVTPDPSLAARNEAIRTAEIAKFCSDYKISERTHDLIESGKSVEQIAKDLLFERTTKAAAAPDPRAVAMTDKDAKRYSYRKAILLTLDRSQNQGRWEGLEAEISDEIQRTSPSEYKARGGVFVPMAVTDPFVRTLDATNATAGKNTVFTEGRELIDILRSRVTALRAGATLLTGLSGPIAFPRITTSQTVNWFIEEGAAVSEADLAFDQVTIAPKTLIGATSYTRQLLAQSSIAVENVVRMDLAAGHARAIDKAAFTGDSAGSSGQPDGIYTLSGILAEAITAPATYTDVVNMQGKVADADADYGSLAYITTPLGAAALKIQPQHATLGTGTFIWNGRIDQGEMAGYPSYATTDMSKVLGGGNNEHGIIFGNWSEMMIAMWGAMELIVDPYAQKKRAWIEVASFQMADLNVRHPASFCKGTGWIA